MTHQVALLPDGRLHLQHGPIDLLCRAWGTPDAVRAATTAAANVFPTLLPALCAQRDLLRRTTASRASAATHPVSLAMVQAVAPYAATGVTPMAAVAGAIADHVLQAMRAAAPLDRAFVNNGGDIAFHLVPGQSLRCALVTDLVHPTLDGAFLLTAGSPTRGIATSGRACKGRGGRSFSFGIADSVTILARTAAIADAAATVVANAVDLPGHPAITRRPACAIDPDSDLGPRRVTWDVAHLSGPEIHRALDAGRRVADGLVHIGLIHGAVLALRGQFATVSPMELAA